MLSVGKYIIIIVWPLKLWVAMGCETWEMDRHLSHSNWRAGGMNEGGSRWMCRFVGRWGNSHLKASLSSPWSRWLSHLRRGRECCPSNRGFLAGFKARLRVAALNLKLIRSVNGFPPPAALDTWSQELRRQMNISGDFLHKCDRINETGKRILYMKLDILVSFIVISLPFLHKKLKRS